MATVPQPRLKLFTIMLAMAIIVGTAAGVSAATAPRQPAAACVAAADSRSATRGADAAETGSTTQPDQQGQYQCGADRKRHTSREQAVYVQRGGTAAGAVTQ